VRRIPALAREPPRRLSDPHAGDSVAARTTTWMS